jgi:uncharacterized protein YutE (UPF0331/DUF86 family)
MTAIETLDKIAEQNGYYNIDYFLRFIASEDEEVSKLLMQEAMQLYAQQFIDGANQIIEPATEILPDTYDEDYEKWYDLININQVKT